MYGVGVRAGRHAGENIDGQVMVFIHLYVPGFSPRCRIGCHNAPVRIPDQAA